MSEIGARLYQYPLFSEIPSMFDRTPVSVSEEVYESVHEKTNNLGSDQV